MRLILEVNPVVVDVPSGPVITGPVVSAKPMKVFKAAKALLAAALPLILAPSVYTCAVVLFVRNAKLLSGAALLSALEITTL